LGNPHFFSGENTQVPGFIRRLGASGVLRIGGNTSEYCYWTPDPAKHANVQNHLQNNLQNDARNLENMRTGDKANPVAFGLAVGPDTGHKAPAPVSITPDAIRNLREFLDACGWKLIYGLNMGTGTAEDAAAEAARVMDAAGSKLIAFQLCNEPDLFFGNGIRRADYDFKQFAVEWQHFYQTIRARLPNAPFAGPDTAYNNERLVPFAKQFKNEAVFLSQHYYAEGPPTDPAMTIERLLRPNPKPQEELEGMKATIEESGLPFRLAETNSCYQGGKQGVSDTYASALWECRPHVPARFRRWSGHPLSRWRLCLVHANRGNAGRGIPGPADLLRHAAVRAGRRRTAGRKQARAEGAGTSSDGLRYPQRRGRNESSGLQQERYRQR
jgi:hypothetical protein